jgi:Zn-dependent peptidase ImmA (M78 family)
MSDGEIRGIVYNSDYEGWKRLTTIAHEIGHHVLGHMERDNAAMTFDKFVSGDKDEQKERCEREAQVFAAAFMAIALFMRHEQKMETEEVVHE